MIHAHAVLSLEAGQSTTDNPLIDLENKMTHHGGAFMASSVGNTMEKTRYVRDLQHRFCTRDHD